LTPVRVALAANNFLSAVGRTKSSSTRNAPGCAAKYGKSGSYVRPTRSEPRTTEPNSSPTSTLRPSDLPPTATNRASDLNGDNTVDVTDFNAGRPFIGTALPGPLFAAPGGTMSEKPLPKATNLTARELAPILEECILRWEAVGLTAEQITALKSVSAQIVDLPSGYLGQTLLTSTAIYVGYNSNLQNLDPALALEPDGSIRRRPDQPHDRPSAEKEHQGADDLPLDRFGVHVPDEGLIDLHELWIHESEAREPGVTAAQV
jgi:hypothetical protein